MMEDFKPAARFGTDIRWGYATEVDFSDSKHKVIIDIQNHYCRCSHYCNRRRHGSG
jgi:hypothetical protein